MAEWCIVGFGCRIERRGSFELTFFSIPLPDRRFRTCTRTESFTFRSGFRSQARLDSAAICSKKLGRQSGLDNGGRERRQAPAKPGARPHSLRERSRYLTSPASLRMKRPTTHESTLRSLEKMGLAHVEAQRSGCLSRFSPLNEHGIPARERMKIPGHQQNSIPEMVDRASNIKPTLPSLEKNKDGKTVWTDRISWQRRLAAATDSENSSPL